MSAEALTPSLAVTLNDDWAANHATRQHHYEGIGTFTGTELRAAISAASGTAEDALLYALIVLAHQGDQAAERVLLQELIGPAMRMAHRATAMKAYGREDRAAVAIGAAWESIRSYALRRTSHVHGNLTMETLRLIAPAEKSVGTTAVTDERLEEILGGWEPAPSPERELVSLFEWALDSGILRREEIALLARIELGPESKREIAADLGVAYDALRKRAARIRTKLAESVRVSLLECA